MEYNGKERLTFNTTNRNGMELKSIEWNGEMLKCHSMIRDGMEWNGERLNEIKVK